jgi:hypothetical protein
MPLVHRLPYDIEAAVNFLSEITSGHTANVYVDLDTTG